MVPICNYLAFSVFFLSPCFSGFLPGGEELFLLSFFPIPFPKLELVSPSSLWWWFLLFFSRTWRLSLLRETEMRLDGFRWWLLMCSSSQHHGSAFSILLLVFPVSSWRGSWRWYLNRSVKPHLSVPPGAFTLSLWLSASPQKFLAGSFFRPK